MSSISLISNLHARNTRGRMLESFKVQQQIKTNAISKSSTYFNSKSTNVHLWALLVRMARSRKTRSELAAVDVMAHVVLCCYSPVAPMTNS